MRKSLTLLLLVFISVQAKGQRRAELDSLLKTMEVRKDDTSKVNGYIELVDKWFFELSQNEKRLYGKKVLSISQQLNFKRGVAGGHNMIGLSNLDKKRDAKTTLSYFDSARAEYIEIGDARALGGALCNIGIVYTTQHLYGRAIDTLLKAKSILEEIHDSLYLANTLCNMGNAYAEQSEYVPALESLYAASTLYEALKDKRRWALANLRVSWVLGKQGKYKEAEIVASPLIQLFYDLSADKEAMWTTAHVKAMQHKGKRDSHKEIGR